MLTLFAQRKPVNCVTFSPDGTRLAAASHGGTVRVWDVAVGAVVQAFELPGLFPNQVRLAYSPDGRHLAATNLDAVAVDLATGARRPFRGRGGAFFGVAYSPDGGQLVAVGDRLGRWDPHTGQPLPRLDLPVPRGSQVMGWPAATFAPDGRHLAVSRRTSRVVGEYWRTTDAVLVCDLERGEVAAAFEWTGHHAHRLAYSPDGRLLAATAGPVLRVWDVAENRPVAALQVGKLHVMAAAFDPRGRYLAAVGKDRAVRFWDTTTWALAETFDWDVGKLLDLAFAPGGTVAAVAADTGKILVFDVD